MTKRTASSAVAQKARYTTIHGTFVWRTTSPTDLDAEVAIAVRWKIREPVVHPDMGELGAWLDRAFYGSNPGL
jgi:hypothetical protein